MLWNRADSSIEPSAYDSSAPAASSSSPKAAAVTLTARDDRDLGDENDTGSGRPDSSAADSASTAKKRDQGEVSRSVGEEQANQPPSRVRCAVISSNTEPFTGDCPVCMVEYVSGQTTCTTCGYEPLPVDEPAQVKSQPNR